MLRSRVKERHNLERLLRSREANPATTKRRWMTRELRAVAAALLTLVGKQGRAFEIAEKIPGALLLEEEKVFLMRAL